MATWLFVVALFSIIVSIFSHQPIAPASAALQGGGPWNPPVPRSRGGLPPTRTPRPRQPRQFDKYYGEKSGGGGDHEDYPSRQQARGRKHRLQDPALRLSYNREQPPYPAYPKFTRRASSRAVGESKAKSEFDNIPGPGPDDMPDAQSPKPADVRKLTYARQ